MEKIAPTLRAGKNETGGDRPPGTDVDTCLTLIPMAYTIHGTDKTQKVASETDIAGCVLARPLGAQENSLTTVIAFTQNTRDEVRQINGDGQIVGSLPAEPGMKQQAYIAFSCKDHGADSGEVAPTLRSMEFNDSHASGGGQVAVAFKFHQGAGARSLGESEMTSPTLNTDWHVPAVSQRMAVRRLTPRECERLQGFPDDYTLIEYHGKPAKDGPRYRAIGNSMAVTVMNWLGRRIQMVDEIAKGPVQPEIQGKERR